MLLPCACCQQLLSLQVLHAGCKWIEMLDGDGHGQHVLLFFIMGCMCLSLHQLGKAFHMQLSALQLHKQLAQLGTQHKMYATPQQLQYCKQQKLVEPKATHLRLTSLADMLALAERSLGWGFLKGQLKLLGLGATDRLQPIATGSTSATSPQCTWPLAKSLKVGCPCHLDV